MISIGYLHELGVSWNIARDVLDAAHGITKNAAYFVLLVDEELRKRKIDTMTMTTWNAFVELSKYTNEFQKELSGIRLSRFYVQQLSDKDWRLFYRIGEEVWIHASVWETWIGAENLRRKDRKDDFHPLNYTHWRLYDGN